MGKKSSKRDFIYISFLALCIAAFAFYTYSLKDDPDETHIVKGVFEDYITLTSTRGLNHYYLKVDGIKYHIPRIYIGAFQEEGFQDHVKAGDSVTMEVTADKSVRQVTNSGIRYIDTKERTSMAENNSNAGLYIGIITLLTAVIMLFKYLKS